MWCENLKTGKVRYVERYQDPVTEKEYKVSVTMDKDTAVNRKRAQNALQMKINEKLKNSTIRTKNEKITLSQLVTLYLEDKSKSVKKTSLDRTSSMLRGTIKYLGGESIVDNLNAVYVKNHLYVGAEKAGTKNERLKRFKGLMKWGYRFDLVEDVSWLAKLEPFENKESKEKLEDKYLEADELKTVLENMKIDKWRFLAEFTALSGLRVGEALALQTSDIHFDEGYINVDKTYDYRNDITTTPKTEDSMREVQMQKQLMDLCKRIKVYMAEERMYMGYRSDLFISDEDGEHLRYAAYNKYLGAVTKRTVGKKATTHFMRHTHVALLAEHGVPLDVISRRLGHADSDITKKIYFHVTEKLKQRDRELVMNINII